MVSDIRTVCPLASLAAMSGAAMYLVTKARAANGGEEEDDGFGLVADSSRDIAAIFSAGGGGEEDAFSQTMQTMFYDFVKEGKAPSGGGVTRVGDKASHVASLENCDFWRETNPPLVPDFGKIF